MPALSNLLRLALVWCAGISFVSIGDISAASWSFDNSEDAWDDDAGIPCSGNAYGPSIPFTLTAYSVGPRTNRGAGTGTSSNVTPDSRWSASVSPSGGDYFGGGDPNDAHNLLWVDLKEAGDQFVYAQRTFSINNPDFVGP